VAKTQEGKKIVYVKGHVRVIDGVKVQVGPYYRSTPE